jgi:hypothetical protein
MHSKLREKTFSHIQRMKDANRFIVSNMVLENNDWYSWGRKVASTYELYALVVPSRNRPSYQENIPIIDFPMMPSQDLLLQLKTSKCKLIPTNEEDLERTLKPILEYARVLRIIDPYVNTAPWSKNSIEIASKLLGHGLKKEQDYKCTLEIFSSEGKSRLNKHQARDAGELKKVWAPIWEIVKSYNHSFRVVIFGKEPGQKELHDRFILTDQCGIMLSTGFSCDKPVHPQVWILLPESSYRTIANVFTTTPSYPISGQTQYL